MDVSANPTHVRTQPHCTLPSGLDFSTAEVEARPFLRQTLLLVHNGLLLVALSRERLAGTMSERVWAALPREQAARWASLMPASNGSRAWSGDEARLAALEAAGALQETA